MTFYRHIINKRASEAREFVRIVPRVHNRHTSNRWQLRCRTLSLATESITKSVAKNSLFPCGWPYNSMFWRKKYYGWKFLFSFFILFLLFIYAQILYFWTIYLPFCVCAVLIVKDLKTIKDLFFFFLPCYCCCSTVQWEIYFFCCMTLCFIYYYYVWNVPSSASVRKSFSVSSADCCICRCWLPI